MAAHACSTLQLGVSWVGLQAVCQENWGVASSAHHQKSSTVSKVYTARRVCPQEVLFWLPLGLSNHRVHLYSKGCFLLKSGSPLRSCGCAQCQVGATM